MKLSGLADWSRGLALLLSGHLLNAIELKICRPPGRACSLFLKNFRKRGIAGEDFIHSCCLPSSLTAQLGLCQRFGKSLGLYFTCLRLRDGKLRLFHHRMVHLRRFQPRFPAKYFIQKHYPVGQYEQWHS